MQYVNIKQAIAEQIQSGQLAASQKLPAERTLAESFNTTRVTLREALSALEAEGKIFREDRRGWFISPPPLDYDLTQIASFEQLASAQQRNAQTTLRSAKSGLANAHCSALLRLPPFSTVLTIERVRSLEARPVVFVTHYAKAERFPNLLRFDLCQSLTATYAQHFALHYHATEYQVSSTSLQGDVALALRATSGTPALVIEKVHVNREGEPLCADVEYWRHDAIRLCAHATR